MLHTSVDLPEAGLVARSSQSRMLPHTGVDRSNDGVILCSCPMFMPPNIRVDGYEAGTGAWCCPRPMLLISSRSAAKPPGVMCAAADAKSFALGAPTTAATMAIAWGDIPRTRDASA
eukprot:364328-Chlamydomonas_euryale.AAC.14